MDITKNEKGVTLVALTITIIVILIVTSTLIYNANNEAQMKKLNNLYSDIEVLESKVSEYYIRHGQLPLKGENESKYCTADGLVQILKKNGADNKLGADDLLDINDDKSNAEYTYCVLDLSKLDNLTLNYGSQYNSWGSGQGNLEIQDLYIINIKSHKIYYPKGVKVDGKLYYAHDIDLSSNITSGGQTMWKDQGQTKVSVTFEDAVEGKIYVAKGGNASIVANVNLSIPSQVGTLSKCYYAWSNSMDMQPSSFTSCSFAVGETNTQTDSKLYDLRLVSNKFESGTYYLWIKLEDEYGAEFITSELETADNLGNGVTLEEKTIELGYSNSEVTIKYDAENLKNIKYGEGSSIEEAKEAVTLIPEDASYETSIDGDRIYTLVISKSEYLYVRAEDSYGNITSAYIWAEQ